jgi:FkbM family methyltransferase
MKAILRKYSYYFFSIFELIFGFENPLAVVRIFLNLTRPGVKTVRLRNQNLEFRVRGAMDVWSIKETFLNRFYEKYGFAIQPDWKVIDIGAGTGEYTIFAAVTMKSQAGQIFAFEPFPESFSLLQENLRLNQINNVMTFTEAIGAETGELVLDLTGGEPLQFQSHVDKIENVKASLPVKSLSLADGIEKTGAGPCDLLKLDCEGAEYAILFGTSQSTLEHIRHIVMEYHDNATQYNHTDLASFLSERGFHVETFPNPVHSYLGYLRAQRNN